MAGLLALFLVSLAGVVPALALGASRYAAVSGKGSECTQPAPCSLTQAFTAPAPGEEVFIDASHGPYAVTAGLEPLVQVHVHGWNGRPELVFSKDGLGFTAGSTVDSLIVKSTEAKATVFSLSEGAQASAVIAEDAPGAKGHACYLHGATLIDSVCWAGTEGDLGVESDGENTLRNDTIYGGTKAAIRAFGRSGHNGLDRLVNVVAHGGFGGVDLEPAAYTGQTAAISAEHSNFSTTHLEGEVAMDSITQGAGNQTEAPLLAGPTTGDFHELGGSPTICAGVTDAANGSSDVYLEPRVTAGATDIGAAQDQAASDCAVSRPGGGGPQANCDPTLQTCDASLIVCVGLWTSVCPGPLVSPPPVQVCVSLWEDCNGFGGTAPSAGGIDLSGLPASLITKTGCEAAATSPFAKSAHSAGRLGARARAAAENPTANSLKGAACLLRAVLQSNDPSKANAALDYAINLQSFQNEDIARAKQELQAGLGYVCAPAAGAPAATCTDAKIVQVAIGAKLTAALNDAGAPGKPVDTSFAIPRSVCATQSPEQPCIDVITHLEAAVTASLQQLAARKHELGLDLPPPSASGSSVHPAAAAARTKGRLRPKHRRTRLIVLASGYLTLPQGRHAATLRLNISPRVRALLRTERARGLKSLTATALTTGTLIPGVQSTSGRIVQITLVKPRPKAKRKHA